MASDDLGRVSTAKEILQLPCHAGSDIRRGRGHVCRDLPTTIDDADYVFQVVAGQWIAEPTITVGRQFRPPRSRLA